MRPQASARKESPGEALTGGNSGKHLADVPLQWLLTSQLKQNNSNRTERQMQPHPVSAVQHRIKYKLLFLLLSSAVFSFFGLDSPSPVPLFFSLQVSLLFLFTAIIFLVAPSCLALRQKLALIPNVVKSGQMLCESDVNPMTTSNMMIYRSQTCAYGRPCMCCWPGSELVSALLTTSSP